LLPSDQLDGSDAAFGKVLAHILYLVGGVPTHQDMKPEREWTTRRHGFGPQLLKERKREISSVTFGNHRKTGCLQF
jgi:hypothetical protein